MNRFALIALTPLIAFTACVTSAPNYEHYLNQKGLETQIPERFQHCHGFGCKMVSEVSFNAQDWKEIDKIFKPAAKTPAEEREKIAIAIALFEQKAGAQTGTHVDEWGTFRKTGLYQLDCIDESTNTTVYLSLLKKRGNLKFHKLEAPSARLPLIHAGRWPHQSAVISEIETSKFFAVDSWFHDNGIKPEIVTLRDWKEGWKPERGESER